MTTTWTIQHSIEAYPGEVEPMHCWSITIDGARVSALWVDTDIHEIRQVETDTQWQDQGMATALYAAATAEMTIYHAPASHRTPDGDRFVERVGGPTHDTCDCCDHLIDDTDY